MVIKPKHDPAAQRKRRQQDDDNDDDDDDLPVEKVRAYDCDITITSFTRSLSVSSLDTLSNNPQPKDANN